MNEYELGKDVAEIKLRLAALEQLIARSQTPPAEFGDLIVQGGMQTAGGFCEGTYDCFADGSRFKIGDRTRIGFYGHETCPGSTTLGDGSSWRLVPGSCNCP